LAQAGKDVLAPHEGTNEARRITEPAVDACFRAFRADVRLGRVANAHTEGSQFGAYDFGIYRAAASAAVFTADRSNDRLLTPVAPYSYPPIAALVAVPMLALPLSVERWLWMVVQLAASVVVAYVASGAIRRTRPDVAPPLTALLVAGLAASLPMRYLFATGR